MFALSLATVAFAAAASAIPTRRDTGPWCANLGVATIDSVPSFTLAAYNATGTNTNTTGEPLVLGQAGAISGGGYLRWLSVSAPCFPLQSVLTDNCYVI